MSNLHHYLYVPGMASAEERFCNRMDRSLLYGKSAISERRRLANLDNRKWAYIVYGRSKMLAMVDNKTMIVYRVDWTTHKATWEKMTRAVFVSWATLWDL